MKLLTGVILNFAALNINAATMYVNGNFTFLDSTGQVLNGTNDVTWSFDDTILNSTSNGTAFNGDIASDHKFFSFTWDAHHIRVFTEGSYTIDTTCTATQIENGVSICNNDLDPGQTEPSITFDVGSGQLGLHMLWDWNTSSDIDIAVVWDKDSLWNDPDGNSSQTNDLWTGPAGPVPDPLAPWQLVSTDADGDGYNGIAMLDGPFQGSSANFNFDATVPIPASVWLFISGLLGLIGFTRGNRPNL